MHDAQFMSKCMMNSTSRLGFLKSNLAVHAKLLWTAQLFHAPELPVKISWTQPDVLLSLFMLFHNKPQNTDCITYYECVSYNMSLRLENRLDWRWRCSWCKKAALATSTALLRPFCTCSPKWNAGGRGRWTWCSTASTPSKREVACES